MPTIYDNQSAFLLNELSETLNDSYKADFCVGYFNLRGWNTLAPKVEFFKGGENAQARVIVGMNTSPDDELRAALRIKGTDKTMDLQTRARTRQSLLESFRRQLMFGFPSKGDKSALLQLKSQLESKKVVVRLHARFPLHAKLYLCHRNDHKTPLIGYLGSSNLTVSGLLKQGELNIDVTEQDAAHKLSDWFELRWQDSLDISADLAKVLGESWVTPRSPFHIYLKMAYHLSREARQGQAEWSVPKSFKGDLFDYQTKAVQLAAHHLNKRGGALIGDVVGLGKTMTAAAIASIFIEQGDHNLLVLCPPNLVKMWNDELERFNVVGRVHAISRAKDLAHFKRYKLVVVDESHNLRSGEGKTYGFVHEYLRENECKVILLSATPYNKHYADLYHQLRLFIEPETSIGIRPENLIKEVGATEFEAHRQYKPDTLGAFSYSTYADDWRELMRLFLVRRTRSFIKEHYAKDDGDGRKYLEYPDKSRFYFPARTPITVTFPLDPARTDDPYARLYSDEVVDVIDTLRLPRYGLENYLPPTFALVPTKAEAEIIANLTRAGTRLMGFCRTGLFKRLESSGQSFLLSVRRHILRNAVFVYAIENDLPLSIGSSDSALLDSNFNDGDEDDFFSGAADKLYQTMATEQKKKFGWLRPGFFGKQLKLDLENDILALSQVLEIAGEWDAGKDAKLDRLEKLLKQTHGDEKVLVFSQFADTVRYLETELKKRGVAGIVGVTGADKDPTALAHRFSPESNKAKAADPIRVLLATDVLSEGQNLQDAHIVVNFDLPWAIIRLIQRAGRVDRIGQKSDTISCYSFMPAEGIEKIIKLRGRLKERLEAAAQTLGTDEKFLDDQTEYKLKELFNEKSGILDEDDDGEVDLASYAFQIWDSARRADPKLNQIIPNLPDIVAGAKSAPEKIERGAIVYLRTPADTDILARLDEKCNVLTQSQRAILCAAACDADTPGLPLPDDHETLVGAGVEAALEHDKSLAGGLGKPSGARYKAYHRLKLYIEEVRGTLWENAGYAQVADAIYAQPLRKSAADQINTHLKLGFKNAELAELLSCLHEENRLVQASDEEAEQSEPRLICSLGLV